MRKNCIYSITIFLLLCSVRNDVWAQQTKSKYEADPKMKDSLPWQKVKRKEITDKFPSSPGAPQKKAVLPQLQYAKKKEIMAKVASNPKEAIKWKAVPLKDLKTKELTAEFPCNPGATIFLENIFRRVTIRTSNDNKVRLVTTVYFQGDHAFTDEEWLQKLELGLSGNAGNVVVKSGNLKSMGTKVDPPVKAYDRAPDTAIANGIPTFDSSETGLLKLLSSFFSPEGNWIHRKSSIKQNIILYIPAGAKLDIESKYADVALENNLKQLKIRITNGSLTMKDAEKVSVTCVYGSLYAGNIDNAEIEMTNGSFTAKTIASLDINSKNSTVNLGTANQVTIRSNNDQCEIDELGLIKGQKNYGGLRVTSLKTSLDISGINADIKIRSMQAGVTFVKIDNQYADLRLPVDNIKNYNIIFEGTGTNVYASFEKTNVTESSFRAAVGDKLTKPASFQVKCNNCTVDFK